jgi:hypothetical protein
VEHESWLAFRRYPRDAHVGAGLNEAIIYMFLYLKDGCQLVSLKTLRADRPTLTRP